LKRQQEVDPRIARTAANASGIHTFVSALLEMPPPPPLAPPSTLWFGGLDGILAGDIYVDGSAFFPNQEYLRRGGWAAVVIIRGVAGGCFGTATGEAQSAPVCELQAIANALEYVLPPFRIIYDCNLIVKGLRRGRAWCTRSANPFASTWRRIWHKLEDLELHAGQYEETFVHMKAHLSAAQALREGFGYSMWIGNKTADITAKQAAGLHPCGKATFAQQAARCLLVRQLGLWIASVTKWVCTRLGGDTTTLPKKTSVTPRAFTRRGFATAEAAGHVITWNGSRPKCARCRRNRKSYSEFKYFTCSGGLGAANDTAHAEVLAHFIDLQAPLPWDMVLAAKAYAGGLRSGLGHTLCLADDLFICGRCGATARDRADGLLRHCGPPTLKGRLNLAALRNLKHPRSGKLLAGKPQFVWAGGQATIGEEAEQGSSGED
jgi:ribonuclease HI